MLGVLRGVRARDPDVGAPTEVDPAHFLDRQRGHVLHVALHQPLEAVADPQDLDALKDPPDGRRADDAVDAGSRPSSDEYRQPLLVTHGAQTTTRAVPARARRLCPVPPTASWLCVAWSGYAGFVREFARLTLILRHDC